MRKAHAIAMAFMGWSLSSELQYQLRPPPTWEEAEQEAGANTDVPHGTTCQLGFTRHGVSTMPAGGIHHLTRNGWTRVAWPGRFVVAPSC